MRRATLVFLTLFAAMPLAAQDGGGFFDRLFGTDQAETDQEQGGMLERFIEDNLSGADRQVSITGFSGALSGKATLDNLTISDVEGPWLTLTDVTLDWNRAAIFRGRLDVTELSAAEILLPRLPLPSAAADAPTPEASGFSLPELPVSVAIDKISAQRVAIGQPVFGVETEVSVNGTLNLEGGEGAADLSLLKLDGTGSIALAASYANQSRNLDLNLTVSEAQNGIVAGLLDLPGRPSVDFSIVGSAPISDFAADIRLATNGTERLAGQITTAAPPDSLPGTLRTNLSLSGDIAPIFSDDYQPFFGPNVRLAAAITSFPDGRLSIESLDLTAASLSLKGAFDLGADGLPKTLELAGQIASTDGPVLLPLSGAETRVGNVDLDIQFDADISDRWTGRFLIEDLERPGFSAEQLDLTGNGQITSAPVPSVSIDLTYAATQLDFSSAQAEAALGETVSGQSRIDWTEGVPIELSELTIAGETYGFDGAANVSFGENGPSIDGAADVSADSLSAFSGLAGRNLSGRIAVGSEFSVQPLAGTFNIKANGTGNDLKVDQPELDGILAGTTTLDVSASRSAQGISIDLETLESPVANITARADIKSGGSTFALMAELTDAALILPSVSGPIALDASGTEDNDRVWAWRVDASMQGTQLAAEGTALNIYRNPVVTGSGKFTATDLSDYSDLANRPLAGAIDTSFAGELVADLSRISGSLTGTATNLRVDQNQADALLAGKVDFNIQASRAGQVLSVRNSTIKGPMLSLTTEAILVPEAGQFRFDGQITDASKLLPGAPAEPLGLTAEGQQDGRDWNVQADAAGAGLTLSADVTALDLLGADPEIDGRITASASDLAPLSTLANRQLKGALTLQAQGSARVDLSRFDVALSANGQNVGLGQAQLDQLIAGRSELALDINRSDNSLTVRTFDLTTNTLTASATGDQTGADRTIQFNARLADAAPYAPGFSGPATANGTITQSGTGPYDLDIAIQGPGGANASVTGDLAPSFDSASLNANGRLPLGVVNTFIAPRAVSGDAGFRLTLNGPLSLASVSGQLTTSGARFIAPALNIAVNGISATADLSGGQAQLALTGNVENGGQLGLRGPVALTAPYSADLSTTLSGVVLRDPRLFETTVNGALAISGPLTGGASISGRLTLPETNIRIPSSGLGGAGGVPEITHLNETPPIRGTRQRAGLLDSPDTASSNAPAFPLDIQVDAPARVFVRGRGLDSEFGGALRITGNTRNVIPLGGFSLIRGRLDILGQRLTLEEANATIQGAFEPFLRIRATTQADEYLIVVTIEGPASDPTITFTSEPELPQEEVLARLIFGRGLETLSPLQAARLALAVRTLAGRGGEGVVGNIRNRVGLADLDVASDEQGNTTVKAGAYLSENVYSDVTVGATGDTEINLNLDVTPSITLKGSVTDSGDTSFGIFFERDY